MPPTQQHSHHQMGGPYEKPKCGGGGGDSNSSAVICEECREFWRSRLGGSLLCGSTTIETKEAPSHHHHRRRSRSRSSSCSRSRSRSCSRSRSRSCSRSRSRSKSKSKKNKTKCKDKNKDKCKNENDEKKDKVSGGCCKNREKPKLKCDDDDECQKSVIWCEDFDSAQSVDAWTLSGPAADKAIKRRVGDGCRIPGGVLEICSNTGEIEPALGQGSFFILSPPIYIPCDAGAADCIEIRIRHAYKLAAASGGGGYLAAIRLEFATAEDPGEFRDIAEILEGGKFCKHGYVHRGGDITEPNRLHDHAAWLGNSGCSYGPLPQGDWFVESVGRIRPGALLPPPLPGCPRRKTDTSIRLRLHLALHEGGDDDVILEETKWVIDEICLKKITAAACCDGDGDDDDDDCNDNSKQQSPKKRAQCERECSDDDDEDAEKVAENHVLWCEEFTDNGIGGDDASVPPRGWDVAWIGDPPADASLTWKFPACSGLAVNEGVPATNLQREVKVFSTLTSPEIHFPPVPAAARRGGCGGCGDECCRCGGRGAFCKDKYDCDDEDDCFELRIRHAYNVENPPPFDTAAILVSVDGGAYQPINQVLEAGGLSNESLPLSNSYQSDVATIPIWFRESVGKFRRSAVRGGQMIRIRFQLQSDQLVQSTWVIDSVCIQKCGDLPQQYCCCDGGGGGGNNTEAAAFKLPWCEKFGASSIGVGGGGDSQWTSSISWKEENDPSAVLEDTPSIAGAAAAVWQNESTSFGGDFAFANGVDGDGVYSSELFLTSPSVCIPECCGDECFELRVKHAYLFAEGDAGRLEISVDGGPFEDVRKYLEGCDFQCGGYGADPLNNSGNNPLHNKRVWQGTSENGDFGDAQHDIPNWFRETVGRFRKGCGGVCGRHVRLSFNLASDPPNNSSTATHWVIDEVCIRPCRKPWPRFTQLGQVLVGEAVNDLSGYSVAMNSAGDRVVVGAFGNSPTPALTGAGHARVFEFNEAVCGGGTGAWKQVGQDIDGTNQQQYSGVSVAINAIGNRVAVGAELSDGRGEVKIWEEDYQCNRWRQIGQTIKGERPGDSLGYLHSISMSGSGHRIAVGSSGFDGDTVDGGRVSVFQFCERRERWKQLGPDILDGSQSDEIGTSVSISKCGNRVAVGSPVGGPEGAGKVRVYEFCTTSKECGGGEWKQLGADIDGERLSDRFGISVSLNACGDTLAVGADNNNNEPEDVHNTGSASVWKYNCHTKKWTRIGSDIEGNAVNDCVGLSVSLNCTGNRLGIGARSANGDGRVQIHQYDAVLGWVMLQSFTGGTGDRAHEVSLNACGDKFAIGAFLAENGIFSGTVTLFEQQ